VHLRFGPYKLLAFLIQIHAVCPLRHFWCCGCVVVENIAPEPFRPIRIVNHSATDASRGKYSCETYKLSQQLSSEPQHVDTNSAVICLPVRLDSLPAFLTTRHVCPVPIQPSSICGNLGLGGLKQPPLAATPLTANIPIASPRT
jgi:hypothetical protein